MVFSSLSGKQSGHGGKHTARPAKVDRFIVHHAAQTNGQVVLDMMSNPSVDLSANYVILNDGTIVGVVPENRRAFTSASYEWDGRAITVEVINDKGAPGWTISAAAENALASLIRDVGQRYGFTPTRAGDKSTVLGHKEIHAFYGAGYPTVCPAGINLTRVVASAAAPLIKEEDMATIVVRDTTGKRGFRIYNPATGKLGRTITKEDNAVLRAAEGASKGAAVAYALVPDATFDKLAKQ
ncbi:peptidoglycan recognition protein family protein [Leucobacter sp. M11]|uniref:peptidoglycan recognition protein family protein n=1 Tax=Leucobacter sp. M11 TaxID=2993565 RepID=UPI002D80C050|nr:N-acetylmuramoyl-L-alanine amidase [Leucobacter sp. M11]MEB4614009.1 N-acetylmuramoyl-L-alanine amidase [Leucobacter sp. M11]